MNKRTSYIDGLKGIAILSIIARHSGVSQIGGVLGTALARPWGTQLFFCISALLAYKSYEKVSDNKNVTENIKWIIKRLLNLAPLYYLAIVLYLLLGNGDSYWLGSDGHITVGNVITHFLFINGLFPKYMNSILEVEWYLGVIVLFYMLLPILHKLINSIERAVALFLASVGITAFILPLIAGLIPEIVDRELVIQKVCGFGFFAQLPALAMGIIMYYAMTDIDFSKIRCRGLLSVCILLFAAILLWGECTGASNVNMITHDTYLAIVSGLIMLAMQCQPLRIVDNKVFSSLGKYIYPIYLFHMLFITLFNRYIGAISQNLIVDWILRYIIILLVSFAVGYVLTRYVDTPIRKRIRL